MDPVARLVAYHAALEPFDADRVSAFFAPDAEYRSDGVGGNLMGRDAILAAFATYFARFPDQQSMDTQVELVAPRTARAHWVLTATDITSGNISRRLGTEEITFDTNGLILSVTVMDQH